ncbi:hypothetical protein NDU88_004181 [Pleurodeles waltl]|uniref:Uncharacterized protein n=1 Tax=Pleurodeles waltl TaxID=8319 RepID=A0AAV7SI26_PLEWA|nr:hypothetical protein NDU88_004181 [Pleurodeles waltl]
MKRTGKEEGGEGIMAEYNVYKLALHRVFLMARTLRFTCATSSCSLVIFHNTRSKFRCICRKAAMSMTAAGVVWVPVEEVWALVGAMSVGGGAGGAVTGPGAVDIDGPAKVPANVGATWVVVVVMVAVVETEGPSWANALHTPEAYDHNALPCCGTPTPHPECGGNASPCAETPESG